MGTRRKLQENKIDTFSLNQKGRGEIPRIRNNKRGLEEFRNFILEVQWNPRVKYITNLCKRMLHQEIEGLLMIK